MLPCVTEELATEDRDNESSLTVIPDHSGEQQHFVSRLLGFVHDWLEITSVGGFVQGCRCIFWFQHFSTVRGEVIKMCKYKYLKSRLFCEGRGLFFFFNCPHDND